MNINSTINLHTGRKMPIIGLGTWKLTDNTPLIVEEALKIGYPMIDTSGDYGTQPGIGEGIIKSRIPRKSVYITTKVEETDDAYQATKKDLEELGISDADLMLIHRPPSFGAGEKLWEGLIKAKEEGLTKDIGVSNYPIELIDTLRRQFPTEMPAVNQIEWSPFGHSMKMLEYCRENDIVIQAYSPLTRAERLDDSRLMEMADFYGKDPAQILTRWSIQLGTVPLPKANEIDHLHENIDVFDFEISDDDMDTLSSLNEHYSALESLPYV